MKVSRGVMERATADAVAEDVFWDELLTERRSLVELDRMSTMERVRLVRQGVPGELLTFLAAAMGVGRETLYQTIGLPRSTGDRKIRGGQRLDADQSERVLGLARLIGRVERLVEESGDPTGFNAARWVASWLSEPLTALGGKPPADLMDTAEGRMLVLSFVGQMQAGTYA